MKVFLQRILIVFPGILGGVLALFLLPFSGFLERVWWDWAVAARLRVGQAAYREVTPRFVLVEIDEASIQDEKKWPLDRKEYARLLDVLDSGDARVVVFDLIFSEPSNPESDRVFAKALSRKTNRYLAFHHTVQGRAGEPTWRDVSRETAVFQPIFPYEPFRKAAREKLGFADVVPDPDGTVRKASLFRLNENKSLPSLGIVVAHGLFDYPLSDPSECVLGKYCLGPLRIPMEPGGQAGLGIGFYPGEINHISISRALGFSKGEAAEYFRDKIIFVAATAEGIRDTVTLPVLGTVPGVFLHIQFLAQILARQFFRPLLPGWTASLLLVLTGVSLGVAFLRLPLFKAVLLLLATATAIWGASAGLLIFCGGVLSPVGLLLAITLTFLCATIWRTFSAEIHGRRAGSLLRQFLPHQVAEHLLSAKTEDLLTKEYHASVLFCDIRGFTALSEQLTASEMMAVVDTYHRAMEAIFAKHGGIALDYQGDAEMVIFGAPQTSDSHALQAVRAAVEMQMELDRLREQWILEGKPCFEMGVGICTGSISLGMVGGAVRKQYTAIGDVANTAARLQGLSVELSSPVLVAESTYKEIINEVWAAPLRKVSLKGKKQSVMVYRINGLKDEERRMRVLKVEPDN